LVVARRPGANGAAGGIVASSSTTMSQYLTDLLSFLLDCVDFIIEQVTLARSSSLESERVAAIDAAMGVIPVIRARLAENEHMAVMFELSFETFISSPFLQIPVHRGQSFRRIADSVPVIADSFR
jgi:hypothetical protein